MTKILLVEDEQLIKDMYQKVFKERGYEVETAEDGEEAVVKLMRPGAKYDLVLLDIMMPKLDGISVLKKIKDPGSAAKNIPVCLLTNLGMDTLIKEALNLGAEQFFVKANYLPGQIVDEVDAYFKRKAEAPAAAAPAPSIPTPPQTA